MLSLRAILFPSSPALDLDLDRLWGVSSSSLAAPARPAAPLPDLRLLRARRATFSSSSGVIPVVLLVVEVALVADEVLLVDVFGMGEASPIPSFRAEFFLRFCLRRLASVATVAAVACDLSDASSFVSSSWVASRSDLKSLDVGKAMNWPNNESMSPQLLRRSLWEVVGLEQEEWSCSGHLCTSPLATSSNISCPQLFSTPQQQLC